jgi:predicted amidophosphoribosyltransferase
MIVTGNPGLGTPSSYDHVQTERTRYALAGKLILIVDDVFTEGFTIREVARALRAAGAVTVSEIVLAREPWKGG